MNDFFDKIYKLLQENWQIAVIGVGVLLLLGAIFNWNWVTQEDSTRQHFWVYRFFGRTGVRILYVFFGLVLIAFGALYLIYQ